MSKELKMEVFASKEPVKSVKLHVYEFHTSELYENTACMDDVNMLSFLDLMKYLLKEKEGPVDQMFFATCDERIEKLLCYKMDGCEIPYTKLTEKEFPKSIEEF